MNGLPCRRISSIGVQCLNMSDHTSAVFNHSCLKLPVNPSNRQPSPSYEQKYIHQIRNEALKNGIASKPNRNRLKSKHKALIDFYDSIPDYSDVNHLSNKEFYRKLEDLKAKQKSYYEFLETEVDIENRCDYGETLGEKNAKPKRNLRCTPDTDRSSLSSKEHVAAPPSRRSVRIESPKSDSSTGTYVITSPRSAKNASRNESRNIGSAGSKPSESSKLITASPIDSVYDDSIGVRSLPSSPSKTKIVWQDCGITIPKPFKMTLRDEEDKIVEEILARNDKPKSDKPEMFRAHDVPIESQIPLFDKIMEEQEMRRQIVKKRSRETLLSKMKPFSFTRREEEEQALTRRLSKSSPQLSTEYITHRVKPFRAKPVPKNLFSNYIYAKMHEDEFYRTLKRRIRAEEMLKASNLPPSMAQRAKKQTDTPICPRALREIERDIDEQIRKQEIEENSLAFRRSQAESISDSCCTSACRPISFRSHRPQKRSRSAKKCHRVGEYVDADNKRAQSALELQSVNRSNLASVLRIQSARKRMEHEMGRRLEEQKFQEEMRWREKTMRRKPVWQELNYTAEDDIAIRLQMRRDEEKLRHEEYKHHMDVMMGRVRLIPTLFERQSQTHDSAPDDAN